MCVCVCVCVCVWCCVWCCVCVCVVLCVCMCVGRVTFCILLLLDLSYTTSILCKRTAALGHQYLVDWTPHGACVCVCVCVCVDILHPTVSGFIIHHLHTLQAHSSPRASILGRPDSTWGWLCVCVWGGGGGVWGGNILHPIVSGFIRHHLHTLQANSNPKASILGGLDSAWGMCVCVCVCL